MARSKRELPTQEAGGSCSSRTPCDSAAHERWANAFDDGSDETADRFTYRFRSQRTPRPAVGLEAAADNRARPAVYLRRSFSEPGRVESTETGHPNHLVQTITGCL